MPISRPIVILGAILLALAAAFTAALILHAPAPSGPVQGAAVIECRSGCADFACFRERYDCMTKTQTPEAAIADLEAAYDTSPIARAQCHQLVHVIGRASADRYVDIGESYRHGNHFCWSGYYHGVMERLLANAKRDGKDIPVLMNTICQNIPGRERYSFDYYNCVHGMGHGVMFFNNYELFQALELCDNLKGAWEQSSCWSGVYMENVIADGFEHTTSYLKPDDPLYPCDAVSDKYKNTCYLMQTSYMLKVTGHDFKKVFELCGQAGEPYIDTCYQSLGRDASGQSLSNVDTTARICSLGKDGRQQVHCLIGAVKDFISYYHSDVQARQLCTVAPKELQKICTDTVDSYYATF